MKTRRPARRPRLALVALVVSSVLAGVSPATAVGTPPAATRSIEEIRTGVAEARARLRDLEVELLVRCRRAATLDWESTTLRRVVAARGACRFVGSSHFDPDFAEALDFER